MGPRATEVGRSLGMGVVEPTTTEGDRSRGRGGQEPLREQVTEGGGLRVTEGANSH